jgi:hypothetical protein
LLLLKKILVDLIIAYKKSLKIPKGDNQKPQIGEEQTIQWLKEKGQISTKHYTEN